MTDYEREALRGAVAENAPRLGFAFGWASTGGTGNKAFKEHVEFGLSFFEKPTFSYGFEVIDWDPDDDVYPLCSAFVFEWIQDSRGYYVGAYVAVKVNVTVDDPLSTAAPNIEHHFTFCAKAWKDVAKAHRDNLP